MKRYHMIVSGQVQGVGFRGFAMILAQQLKITGTVANLDNGMVEIFAQGEEYAINEMIKEIYKGNRFIKVTDISTKEVPVVPGEKKFTYGSGQHLW